MIRKILDSVLCVVRVVFFAALIISIAAVNFYGDKPELQCLIALCCVCNIALSLHHFFTR